MLLFLTLPPSTEFFLTFHLTMGNDGGSIPKRRELVKEAARTRTATELKESQHEQQDYYWTTDPISQKPLTQPIVSDSSGKLYNKETILEFLVEGNRKEDANSVTQGAVKSLKDIVEVKFEVDSDASSTVEVWKCPVTGNKLGPGSKAVYIVPCGHVFSSTAIKEVSGEKCLTCDTEYASNDIIPILSTSELDIARLSLRAKTLQADGLTHSLKKASGAGKKRKKKDETIEGAPAKPSKDTNGAYVEGSSSQNPNGAHFTTHSSGIKDASTASLAAKVMAEQERAKKRKTESDNVRSLFSSKDASQAATNKTDFMTRGFSIPKGAKR